MIKITQDPESQVLMTVAIARLTEEDWHSLLTALEKQIEQGESLKWYFEMEDFGGESHKIRWQEVSFTRSHPQGLERIAIVGNKEWHGWMQDLMEDFHSAEIRFFETQDQQLAHQWISQDNPKPSAH
jgi:hypothetical protein